MSVRSRLGVYRLDALRLLVGQFAELLGAGALRYAKQAAY
jgi:hypothetical protein